MTSITKAIEAAIEALKSKLLPDEILNDPLGCSWQRGGARGFNNGIQEGVKALAALPDKPMTEEEIANIIYATTACSSIGDAKYIIRALKAANVLYCEE